jgi:ATP-dependent helicase/nuclease subunit B
VQVEFVIGPAGSGKTFLCLEQVRAALKQSPEGPPLLFLAPKQATFQLERELLSDPELPGYTRLQILSFDRLAEFVLDNYFTAPPRLLSEEGRVMVLRAILAQEADRLRLFRASARLPGFARELSKLVRELQTHKIGPEQLKEAAGQGCLALPHLRDKLHDLALMLAAYSQWLKDNRLEDPDRLHELATEALRGTTGVRIAGLWMDGFGEMTPGEVDLLAAIVPHCEHATLAFCLDQIPSEDAPWLSCWSVLSQTFRKCFHALESGKPKVTLLPRDPIKSRFAGNSALRYLEAHWTDVGVHASACPKEDMLKHEYQPIRAYECANPEAEATLAAREIMRFVREEGGRFRDAAVIVRRLDDYHDALRRVFNRYEIPFFLDRREPVAHHALAELTRYALRTIAFGWKIDDWFGALKCGLLSAAEVALDDLEIEASARGWRGEMWLKPMPPEGERFEPLRKELARPFAALRKALGHKPTGHQLGNALRWFWDTVRVEQTLSEWDNPQLHATVWAEMLKWVDNVELAFGSVSLSLRDWLPIIETGLGALTVGVVPPALDQVLIGSVDRSRNPNLRLALVLGMNDGVFPETPAADGLLTDLEREALHDAQMFLAAGTKRRIGHERFYAYIACTRARERLVLTCSQFDAQGKKLNRSPFLDHLRRLFPSLEVVPWMAPPEPVRRGLPNFPALSPDECLSADLAAKLYGPELQTSVTRIEQFAACPFRFFVTSGLHAQEQRVFEVDAKKRGQFQHEVLRRFHEALREQGLRWKDLVPAEARERVRKLAVEHARQFEGGLFMNSERDRFTVGQLTAALEQFVEKLVGWMREKYLFEPAHVELKFHDADGHIPAWRLPLSSARQLVFTGSIDRVDLFRLDDNETLCVVIDYKSSDRKIEPLLLANGIQMQLPAYLSVLRHLKQPGDLFGTTKLTPAGVFYVNLRATYDTHKNRKQALSAQAEGFKHIGRFDQTHVERLDSRAFVDGSGDQFNYTVTSKNALSQSQKDPMRPEEFLRLLDLVEAHLKSFGERIYRGEAQVSPYRNGSKTPCSQCDYRPICRFDPWEQSYRALKEAEA